jgi:hypothetical protein
MAQVLIEPISAGIETEVEHILNHAIPNQVNTKFQKHQGFHKVSSSPLVNKIALDTSIP